MADETKEDSKQDANPKEKFQVLIDPGPPMIAFVQIPFGKYIDDKENGVALLHGKLKEAEAKLSKEFVRQRQQKAMRNGIIGPTGAPLSVA